MIRKMLSDYKYAKQHNILAPIHVILWRLIWFFPYLIAKSFMCAALMIYYLDWHDADKFWKQF